MRTIGLIGGMSWESTVPYYQTINRIVARELGGLHSAKLLLHSVNFADIEMLQRKRDWDTAGELLAKSAQTLQRAGAECIVLCTNTMHRVADQIEAVIQIDFIHIADPTAAAIKSAGFQTVGLLGTRFTMEEPFYRERLEKKHGQHVLVPSATSRDAVHKIIYEELCRGTISPKSRDIFQRIGDELRQMGAQALILGCTEIGLLLQPEHSPLPLFDTAYLHAEAAARWALRD